MSSWAHMLVDQHENPFLAEGCAEEVHVHLGPRADHPSKLAWGKCMARALWSGRARAADRLSIAGTYSRLRRARHEGGRCPVKQFFRCSMQVAGRCSCAPWLSATPLAYSPGRLRGTVKCYDTSILPCVVSFNGQLVYRHHSTVHACMAYDARRVCVGA